MKALRLGRLPDRNAVKKSVTLDPDLNRNQGHAVMPRGGTFTDVPAYKLDRAAAGKDRVE